MWEYIKYIIIIYILFSFLISKSYVYIHFALISELMWLCIFFITTTNGYYIEDSNLYFFSVLIIFLLAIEVVVFWCLIILMHTK